MFGPGHIATVFPHAIGGGLVRSRVLAVSFCLRSPQRLKGAGFCHSASRSVSGRVAADNAAVFMVKDKRRFKGVAREISVGGMMAGRPRILFPRWPLGRCTDAVRAAVPVESARLWVTEVLMGGGGVHGEERA